MPTPSPRAGCDALFARLRRLRRPRFEDPVLQKRFEQEFRARVLRSNKTLSKMIFGSTLASLVTSGGPQDMPLTTWLLWKVFLISMPFFSVSMILLLSRSQRAWRYYDGMTCAALCLFMVNRISTARYLAFESPAPYSEALNIFLCICGLTCWIICVEPDMRWVASLVNVQVIVWVAKGNWDEVGMSQGLFLGTVFAYYFTSLCLMAQARQRQQQQYQVLEVQAEVERLAALDTAAAKEERDKALLRASMSEQKAMQSMLLAIFDICGALQWHPAHDLAEPQLCFSAEPNPQLDEVLLQPASGQPLDILLGPTPAVNSKERARWLSERERLWRYATLEAVAREDETTEMARKISLTGANLAGQPFELELFVAPCSDGRVLFGIRAEARDQVVAKEQFQAPGEERNLRNIETVLDSVRRNRTVSGHRAHSDRAPSASGSSCTAESLPLDVLAPDGAQCVWVDVAQPELPILKTTADFLALLGTRVPGEGNLHDLLVDPHYILGWLQECCVDYNQKAGSEDVATTDIAIWTDRRHGEQIRASCTADVSQALEGGHDFSEGCLPVQLSLHNAQKYRMKKQKRRKSRESPRGRRIEQL